MYGKNVFDSEDYHLVFDMKKERLTAGLKREMTWLIIFSAALLHILFREYRLYDKVGGCVEKTNLRDERMYKIYSLKARTVSEAWAKDYRPERQVEGQPCATDMKNQDSKTEELKKKNSEFLP